MSVEWSTDATTELAEAYRELRESHLAMLSILDDTLSRNALLAEDLKNKEIAQLPISPNKDDSYERNFFTTGEKLDKFGDELESETIALKGRVPELLQKQMELEAENKELKEALEVSKKSIEYLKADRDAFKLKLTSLENAKAMLTNDYHASQSKLEEQLDVLQNKNRTLEDQVSALKSSLDTSVAKNNDLAAQLEETFKLLEDERARQQDRKDCGDSLASVEQGQDPGSPAQGPQREPGSPPLVEAIDMRVPKDSADKDNILDDIVIVEDRVVPEPSLNGFNTLGAEPQDRQIAQPYFGSSPPGDDADRSWEQQRGVLEERLEECQSLLEAERKTNLRLSQQARGLKETIEDLRKALHLQRLDFESSHSPKRRVQATPVHGDRSHNQILRELKIENNLMLEPRHGPRDESSSR